jgi:4-azaleucine resistance transporter AzlC
MKPLPTSSTASQATFTLSGIRAGFAQSQVLAAGVVVYGVAFGVLASQARYSTIEAMLMSAFIYSGSAQLAVLQNREIGNLLLPATSLIVMMNARYLFYGATLRPWMGSLPPHQSYANLFFLGDGSWVLSMRRWEGGQRDAGFLLGSGLAMYAAWLLGTVIGHVAGNIIGDPQSFALDFMLVAFSVALLVEFWKGRNSLAPTLTAIVTALCFNFLTSSGWTIVASGLAGGVTAFLTFNGKKS